MSNFLGHVESEFKILETGYVWLYLYVKLYNGVKWYFMYMYNK